MKALTLRLYKKYHQFIRFGLVGATNFLVSYIVYRLVLWLFGLFPDGYNSSNSFILFIFHLDYQIANTLAFIISVLNAYILNRLWVFKREAKKTSQGAVLRFFASYGITFILSLVLAKVWVDVFSIPKAYGPFLSVLITTPLNFLLSKYFAFREKKLHVEGVELLPFDEEDVKEVSK